MSRRLLAVAAALNAALFLAPMVHAGEPLPKDDNNVYGQFDNGFRYIIRKHAKPPGRVALYLHIKTGALNETKNQNGLAHFLEHMAFNGSKHFKPGELVPYLNSLGMQFGADTNAHTNQHETVYKLFLPDTKEETIEKCLTVLEDNAAGLLLREDEINDERKVILEELRAGKSAAERLNKEMMRKVFPGAKISVHDVIGDEEQIKTFPKKEFDDYWNTWYCPENMTLIIVGDIEPKDMINRAKAHFAGITARGEARPPGRTGIAPVDKARAFVLTDKEQVVGSIEMMTIRGKRDPMKTVEDYRFNEVENIGNWIVNRRLDEMTNKGTAKFRGAGTNVESAPLNDAILPSASVQGEPEDWKAMLEQVIVEINRAITHGFTPEEMDLARTALISGAQRAVDTEPTADARAFVTRLASSVGQDHPILSAQQRLDLYQKILPTIKVEEVNAVFAENYKTKNYAYVLMMPEKKDGLKLPTDAEVLAAAEAAWAKKTEKPKADTKIQSLVEKLPAPGKIDSKTTDADLKITTATYSNGVVLHHRYMDYKEDEAMVRLVLPGGQIEETVDNKGVSSVGSLILSQPATSRFESTQIRDFMTGKKVRVGGGIGRDSLDISIGGKPSELAIGFELVHALMTDGRLESSALDNWKKAVIDQLEQLKKTPGGPMRKAMDHLIFGDDPRFVQITPEVVKRQTAAAGEAWFKRIAATAPIEITIVGDIDFEAADALVSKYIACLPKRTRGFSELEPLRKIKRGPGPFKDSSRFESITPKALAIAGFLSCDERDVEDRRILNLAGRILSDRMIKEIREKQQLVYSIGCQNQPGRDIPGTGMMIAGSMTDPENGDKLADVVLSMIKDFADNGPTEDEVKTAKKQMANSLETQMKEPGFWLGQISEMTYRNRPLDELKQLPDVFQSFTGKQIQAAVKKYMTDDRIIRIVATPEEEAAKARKSDHEDDEPDRDKSKSDEKEGHGKAKD